MMTLCQEVQKFISACEGLQSLLAQGGKLTDDEKGMVEEEMLELLWKLNPKA